MRITWRSARRRGSTRSAITRITCISSGRRPRWKAGAKSRSARRGAEKVPHHHAGALAWTADFPVTPWLAYVRFGRWKEMLTEPAPPANEPYATGIWHYARALAYVARDQEARADAEVAALATV